ncbi:MAG: prolipoprotein diacylglyceryl transferase [Phycisphaerales bacterium]|nr:prolipoprotein diacylglyceryl transferase [Phycisphaerales bacterium]
MTLASWLHDLSPFAVPFGGGLGIRWYGISYALGFLVGWLLLRWLSRRGATLIPPDRVGDVILYAVVGVVAGGRLGYALFYKPALFWTFSHSAPWWGLLAVNEGGMSSHGGMIGIIIAAWCIARGRTAPDGSRSGRVPMLHVLDVLTMIGPAGLFFGRLANFVNGELLGKIVALPGQPAPWWAVRFPQEYLEGMEPPLTPQQQSQLSALVAPFQRAGDSFEDAMRRVIERLQHGDAAIRAQLEPLVSARHPSQLYQAAAEGLVVGAIVWFIARRPRLPGVVGCWFLISYGVLRVVTELWRLPDSNLGRPYGLSRGQWLSVLMVAAGLVALTIIKRRGGAKVGGWNLPSTPA